MANEIPGAWNVQLEGKPDFDVAMRRIDAWFAHEIIDRPPIRFSTHNAEYDRGIETRGHRWASVRERWLDAEFQVETFARSIEGVRFLAETFPVFWPNLGPGIYAAFHGAPLEFREVTSWTTPIVKEWSDAEKIRFDPSCAYFRAIDELTRLALERCAGKFLVGYTDLHGALDCAADWRDRQELCIDTLEAPERVRDLVRRADDHFLEVLDRYDALLKAHGQPSVTWIGIPSFGKLHIPSADFAALISPAAFDALYLPSLLTEVRHMTHNIYHLDGKDTLRHLPRILAIEEIQAIQWVQGVGADQPILQWLPVITRMQAAGKSVIVDLTAEELEPFIGAVDPEGLYLCIAADAAAQPDIIRRVERW